MEEITRESAAKIAMAMYMDEPCRICGVMFGPKDQDTMVFAGYSEGNESR